MNSASLPSHFINRDQVSSLPQTHGVYYFVNEQQNVIYVGKSVNLRQRVKSHFSAAKRLEKERKLSLHTHTIHWQETAGELSALLLESHEIKRLQPFYNRRLRRQFQQFAWQLTRADQAMRPRLVKAEWPPRSQNTVSKQYGAFKSLSHARKALMSIVKERKLCAKVLGLESSGRSCFAYQLKQCLGACVGAESIESHNIRTLEALHNLALSDWPFTGLVGIIEMASPDDVNLFNSWFYLGTHHKTTITELAEDSHCDDAFGSGLTTFIETQTAYELDRDSYKILLSFVTHKRDDISLIDYSEA